MGGCLRGISVAWLYYIIAKVLTYLEMGIIRGTRTEFSLTLYATIAGVYIWEHASRAASSQTHGGPEVDTANRIECCHEPASWWSNCIGSCLTHWTRASNYSMEFELQLCLCYHAGQGTLLSLETIVFYWCFYLLVEGQVWFSSVSKIRKIISRAIMSKSNYLDSDKLCSQMSSYFLWKPFDLSCSTKPIFAKVYVTGPVWSVDWLR